MTKPNVLFWSDWFGAGTGFGTVSKYVIKGLLPRYNIDQLAINYNGQFFDSKEFPVQVSPAKLLNPQDPHGSQMFVNAILTGKYDYVWIMNDTFVVEKVGKEIDQIKKTLIENNKKIPIFIFYYPIDCQLPDTGKALLKAVDVPVAYCQFGKEQTLLKLPELADKLHVITHGVDMKSFRKVSDLERQTARERLLKVNDPNTFVWMNANRNNLRKDIAHTISAFKEFKKEVPNSKLYLHTAVKDNGNDLSVAVKQLGLSLKDDVIFPVDYSAAKPYPVGILNLLYNAADGFITTTLGEGWGLTHLDAALVRVPIVAPTNTCFPEQLDNGSRAYLYPCKEQIWVDTSGIRPRGQLKDITDQMMQCYQDVRNRNTVKIDAAYKYAESISWDKIVKQWVELFDKATKTSTSKQEVTIL